MPGRTYPGESLADDNTQQVAQRLGTAIDSSTRLALIQALSDAASSISADLAPASIDVRIVGGEPEFAVSVPTPSTEPTMITPTAEEDPRSEEPEIDDDEPIARINLRLPHSAKDPPGGRVGRFSRAARSIRPAPAVSRPRLIPYSPAHVRPLRTHGRDLGTDALKEYPQGHSVAIVN